MDLISRKHRWRQVSCTAKGQYTHGPSRPYSMGEKDDVQAYQGGRKADEDVQVRSLGILGADMHKLDRLPINDEAFIERKIKKGARD